MKMLGKMQRRATIWILEAFKMFPSFSVEVIAGVTINTSCLIGGCLINNVL